MMRKNYDNVDRVRYAMVLWISPDLNCMNKEIFTKIETNNNKKINLSSIFFLSGRLYTAIYKFW